VIGSVILMEARGRGGLCGVPADPTSHNCVMFESMRSERADHFRAARRDRSADFIRGPGESYSDVILRMAKGDGAAE
jgi:hypothetical protein